MNKLIKKKFKIIIGYENCYFGFFHPVKEIIEETPDKRKIKEIGKEILGQNYDYIAWRIELCH